MPARTAPAPTSSAAAVLEVVGPIRDRYDEILTPDALAFLTELHSRFSARRHDRLADRMRRR
ncbi:MAG TPA: malate synthase A, partial [Microbacterium sp.]|nr:malate synthase A [Microbacterium sp.]